MDVSLLKEGMGIGPGGRPHGYNNNIINTTLNADITQHHRYVMRGGSNEGEEGVGVHRNRNGERSHFPLQQQKADGDVHGHQHQEQQQQQQIGEFYDHYAEEEDQEDPTPSEMGVARASGGGLPFANTDSSPTVMNSAARGGLAPPPFSTSYFASNNIRSNGGNSYFINNTTTGLSLQQQQQQARQAAAAANAARVEEAKVLNRKLEAFERQLSKVRVLWAEVLHVCPEQHVLKSTRSACGTSLAEKHTEEEYVAALMRPHIVTRSSNDTGISQTSPRQQGGQYVYERRVAEAAEGIRPILAAAAPFATNQPLLASSDGSVANTFSSTASPSLFNSTPSHLFLPHPLLVPSYPLSASDSYDKTREVCQRWVYALHGVGLRSPHEHLHYVEERSSASEAMLVAMKGAGGQNGQQQQQQAEGGVKVANNKFREIAVRCAATSVPHSGEDGHEGTNGSGVLGYRAESSDGATEYYSSSADGNVPVLLLSSAMTGRPSPSLSLCSRYSHASLLCYPLGSDPTAGQMNFLQDEVRRLSAIRDARAVVEEAITVREGFVFYLQSLLSDFTLSEASTDHNSGNSGGGIDGLNNDQHASNDGGGGGSSLLRGFLDIEQGWRDGAAQLVERLERQIAFYETEGDLALRSIGDQQEENNSGAKASMHSPSASYSTRPTTTTTTTTAVVINAVRIAQQIHRIHREAAEAGNMAIAQQQQLQQQQHHRRSVGALITSGRHRLTPHLNPRDATSNQNDHRQRKPSQQIEGGARLGTLTFEEAEAATQSLVNTLTTAADQTFSAPDGLPYAALPLSQTLQVNMPPPPLVVPPRALISTNMSSVDDAEGDEEEGDGNSNEGLPPAGGTFPNPVANLVSTTPITSGAKINRMESNLLLVREQLGVLLHSRPPIGFASASGSAAGEIKSGGGGGSTIGPTLTKASPIVNTTAPTTTTEKKKTTVGGASGGRRYGSGAAGGASSSSSSASSTPFNLLFSTTNVNNTPYNLSYSTATNQPNALRKALKGALGNVRRSSFDVVRAVEAWRSLLLQHPAIKEHNSAVYAAHQAAIYCSTPQSNNAEEGEEEEATIRSTSTISRFCSDVLPLLMAGFDPVATVLTSTRIIGNTIIDVSAQSSSLNLPSTPPFVVPVFLWRGSSYVAKMSSDLSFLVPFLRPLKERGEFIEKMIKTVRPFVLKPLNGTNSTNNYNAYSSHGNNATSTGSGYAGAYSDSEGGGELKSQPGDFAAEFCRLRKAQCYILKQLIKTTEKGFFLREAVAAALGEALELCDPEGNPFLNPSRRFPNYSALAVARAVYNDEGGAGHFGGGMIGPYSNSKTKTNSPTPQSPSGGLSFISPLLAFFSVAHRYAVLKRLESERMRDLYGGVGTALLLASSEGYSLSSNEAANVINALNSYSFYGNDPTAASQHNNNNKSNGLPDILRSGSNNSVRAYFRGSDEASARREVDPDTYAWAESCVLAELLAMGRQLSLSGGPLDSNHHCASHSNTLRLLSRLVEVLTNERLSSALPLHEHITSLARKITKVTKKARRRSLMTTLPNQAAEVREEGMKPFSAFASDSSRRTSAASGFVAYSNDATAAVRTAGLSHALAGHGGEADAEGDEDEEELDAAGSHEAPLRSYSFERLNKYGTVLRQKEALARLELRAEARRASLSAKLNSKKRKTGQDEAISSVAPTIVGHHGINRLSTSSYLVGGGGRGMVSKTQHVEADAAAEAAAAILATNTTSKGVYVRPDVMAAMEAECAGITFSSGVADIQYDMVSMYEKFMINPPGDGGGGGDAEGGAGGSLADGDRQSLLLVLRRMGKSDPTLAAHLRVMNARRHPTAAVGTNGKFTNDNNNKLTLRGSKAAAHQRYSGGGEAADESMLAAAAAAVGLGALPKSSGLIRNGRGGHSNNKSSLAPPTAIPIPSFIANNTLLALGRMVRFAKRQFDMLETDEDRDDFSDIITCQALWRGRQARRYTKALRTLHNAARSIQGVRKCREAASQLADKRLQHRSAIKIQSLVRGVLARRAVAMIILVIKAATTIQRYYRGYKSRKEATLRRQLVSSVVKIQKSFRGFEERRAADQYKSLTYNNAAIAIQRMWRGGALRASGAASPSMIKAATKIQSFWRGVSARRHVARLKSLHIKATAITSLVKGGHERRTVVRERVEARGQARARGLEAVEAAAKAAEEAIPEVFELPKGSRYRHL